VTQTSKEKIGFIGVGLMGRPMVLRLLQAGYPVRVWNRTPEKLAVVTAAGAEVVDSIGELVRQSDLVLLCLANTEVVRQVVFASGGVADMAVSGQLLVDLSSIEPDATREFAAQLKHDTGMRWVDAPVSGGVVGAEKGSLAIMAGGLAEDIERIRPVLSSFSQRLTHMRTAPDRSPRSVTR
jgi:3-hydroxyisobutyrate dehydrogenase